MNFDNLKKPALLVVSILLVGASFAQKRAVNSAEYALESGTPEDLIIAHEEIEKAKEHPKTATFPRMWLVRARVYQNVFDKRGNPMLAKIKYQSGLESARSIMNYYDSKEKKTSTDDEDARYILGNCFAATFNETQNYSEAFNTANDELKLRINDTMLTYFEYLINMHERLDTAMINELKGQKVDRPYFVERLAYYALNNSDVTKRMATLDYLITNETPIPFVVENYSRILLEKGDTLGAKEVIKKALVKSNYNNDIFNVLVNYYLAIDRQDQLMAEVDGQIAEVPNSKNYWIRGYLNERAGNYAKATADYQKARELDEFSFDANWNLGVALMKYETKDLIDQISKTNDAVEKAKLESKKNETFKTARSYLEFASENINYSKEELINISNAIRTCCLELGDEKCTSEQRDRVRTLNGFEFKIGDKFTYRITGDATKMQISYQNARNTNSTIYDQNGNWEKEFDCVDKTDLLSLSVTIKGDGEATLYIIVNGVPVDEKTISGNGSRGYLRF